MPNGTDVGKIIADFARGFVALRQREQQIQQEHERFLLRMQQAEQEFKARERRFQVEMASTKSLIKAREESHKLALQKLELEKERDIRQEQERGEVRQAQNLRSVLGAQTRMASDLSDLQESTIRSLVSHAKSQGVDLDINALLRDVETGGTESLGAAATDSTAKALIGQLGNIKTARTKLIQEQAKTIESLGGGGRLGATPGPVPGPTLGPPPGSVPDETTGETGLIGEGEAIREPVAPAPSELGAALGQIAPQAGVLGAGELAGDFGELSRDVEQKQFSLQKNRSTQAALKTQISQFQMLGTSTGLGKVKALTEQLVGLTTEEDKLVSELGGLTEQRRRLESRAKETGIEDEFRLQLGD
jgi:hypothetical protein